jgi:hypothetical protein
MERLDFYSFTIIQVGVLDITAKQSEARNFKVG